MFVNYSTQDNIFQTLKFLPNLQFIDFSNNSLSNSDSKGLGRVLSDFNFIRSLNLSRSGLNVQSSKEIADGLMRAKQIESINLSGNPSCDSTQILYNLAFSPKIKHIDLSDVTSAKNSNTAEALFKLLKISGSIQTLILNNIGVANYFT